MNDKTNLSLEELIEYHKERKMTAEEDHRQTIEIAVAEARYSSDDNSDISADEDNSITIETMEAVAKIEAAAKNRKPQQTPLSSER